MVKSPQIHGLKCSLMETMPWQQPQGQHRHDGTPPGPAHVSVRPVEQHSVEEVSSGRPCGSRAPPGLRTHSSSSSHHPHPLWARSQALPGVLLSRAAKKFSWQREKQFLRKGTWRSVWCSWGRLKISWHWCHCLKCCLFPHTGTSAFTPFSFLLPGFQKRGMEGKSGGDHYSVATPWKQNVPTAPFSASVLQTKDLL